ncbi:MAG: hypothetical protein ACREEE_04380 [Dongiaceae bacterium]
MARLFDTRKKPKRSTSDLELKQARLREQRLANEAARREAGTWGEMSVGEITNVETGEVFVLHWKGQQIDDLARLSGKRATTLSLDEHRYLAGWLSRHEFEGFQQAIFAWDVTADEAKRLKLERIDAHRVAGRPIINHTAGKP